MPWRIFTRASATDEGNLLALHPTVKPVAMVAIRSFLSIGKTMADGILSEFASVVDALRCALDVQRGMDGRNADVSADRRIEFQLKPNGADSPNEKERTHEDCHAWHRPRQSASGRSEMASQSIGVLATRVPKWPTMLRPTDL
jgi:hypothetical protein